MKTSVKKKANASAWRKANPEATALIQQRCDSTPERKAYHRARQHTPAGRWVSLKGAAKQRGLVVELTTEEHAHLIQQPCHYCGGPLATSGSGLDRTDSTRGYLRGNVVPCCHTCNTAKGTMSVEEFYAWVDRVHRLHTCEGDNL